MASDRSRQRYWREESPEPSDSDEATIPDPEQFQTADPDHRSLAHQFESDLIELEGEDRLLMTVWEDDWVVLLWVHTVEAGTQDFDDDEDEASNDNESAADVQQYPSEPSESLQQRGTADPSWLSVSSGLSTIVEASELSELGQGMVYKFLDSIFED